MRLFVEFTKNNDQGENTLMRAYIKISNLSFQNQMEYKTNFIMTFLYRLLPFMINILVWLAISDSSTFTMSKDEIVTYYMVGLITSNLVVCSIQNEISEDIRMGTINKYLIKPINYFGYQFMKDVAFRITFIILGIIPIAILFSLMKSYIVLQFHMGYCVLFIVSIMIGYIINFLMSFLLSELSFYFNNVSVLFSASDVLKNIISGSVFPLMLLPAQIADVLMILPFSYISYFPTIILLQDYSIENVLVRLLIGIIWCIVLGELCHITWKQGIKSYSSFGG